MKHRWAVWLRGVPGLAPLARRLRGAASDRGGFPGSAEYWRQRYAGGADSGPGSYGKFARFKARVLNDFFKEQGVQTVIEFGSGDGNQLALLDVPEYLGVDISPEAVGQCRARFAGAPGRRFILADQFGSERADCTLSLDVIYHLVEDAAFDAYMRRLFASARCWVVVYSSNREADAADGAHVRHRRFTDWIAANEPGWRLFSHVPNEHPYRGDYRTGSFADFYFYANEHAADA
jgi:SAM-dependent methyltransferase